MDKANVIPLIELEVGHGAMEGSILLFEKVFLILIGKRNEKHT
jgi:hypothetical protein